MAWLYKQPGSKKWWIGYRANGKLVRRSLGVTKKKDAQKELEKIDLMTKAHRVGRLQDELYRILTGTGSESVPIEDAVDDWLSACQGRLSDATIRSYTLEGTRLKRIFTGLHVAAITPQAIRAELDRFGSPPSGYNHRMRCWKAFFNHAVDNKLCGSNPVAPVKPKKVQPSRRRGFTPQEVSRALDHAPTDFWRWMILAGFFTGQRMGDLVTARWEDIDLRRKVWKIHQGKTARRVVIPLSKQVLDLLKTVKPKQSGWLWPEHAAHYKRVGASGFSGCFLNEILRPAGLVKKTQRTSRHGSRNEVSFHSLRFAFVSALRAAGVDQAAAQSLAGHATAAMSAHYTAIPMNQLRAAVDVLEIPQ